jgi:hypothetical protein
LELEADPDRTCSARFWHVADSKSGLRS